MLGRGAADAVNVLVGFCELRVQTASPEAFLSAVMHANVDVWSLRKPDAATLLFKARTPDVGALTALAVKMGASLTPVSRRGLPVFLRRYKARYGLLCGAVLFFFVLSFLSSFLWSVDVRGNLSETETEAVLDVLRENGFYVGAPVRGQHVETLKLRALSDTDDVGYLCVRIEGTKATVDVTRKVEVPPLLSHADPCNLVASDAGVITEIRAYNGITAVKVGDAVTPGQLLVGGVYDSRVLGYRTVHASAAIFAQVQDEITVFVGYADTPRDYTGNEESYAFAEIFGHRIAFTLHPQSPFADSTVTETLTPLTVGQSELPVCVGRVTYRETVAQSGTLSYRAALETARRRADEKARVAYAGLAVLDRTETVTATPEGVSLTVRTTVIKDICKEQRIVVEE